MAVKALTTAMMATVIMSWRMVTPASVFRVLVVIILPSMFVVLSVSTRLGPGDPTCALYNERAKSRQLANRGNDVVVRCKTLRGRYLV